MLRAVLVMVVVGACGAQPAEKLEKPRAIPHAPEVPTIPPRGRPAVTIPPTETVGQVLDAPPVLDAPAVLSAPPPPDPKIAAAMAALDPTEYVRWPLTYNKHPVLEPAYDIATVFAQPGVSWLDLCRLGAQNRRGGGSADQLEYLRAWCDVAKRDARSAVGRLALLRTSTVLGIPAAVRADVANIVVDAGTADDAQRILAGAQVDDLAIFDLVAASYAEIGKTDDSLVFTERGIAAHDARRPADHCMRLARKVLLVDPHARTPTLQALTLFEHVPACATVLHELKCWHAQVCEPYLLEHGVGPDALALGALYKDWPRASATSDDWLKFAHRALRENGKSANEATTSAIEAALRTVGCVGAGADEGRSIARRLKTDVHDASVDQRLDLIILTPDSICAPSTAP
jgi:hypothetical protein